MKIQTFVKRPVRIEAVQVTEKNIRDVCDWANTVRPAHKQVEVFERLDRSLCLLIPTKEGKMECNINDYLIKEPFPTDDRMFYPCKADMFHLTYVECEW